jgi:hypothetical protein
MSASPVSKRELCDDLLIEQTIYGLRSPDDQQLCRLVSEFGITDDDRFDRVVGALDAGLAASDPTGNPDDLMDELCDRIVADAASYMGVSGGPPREQDFETLRPVPVTHAPFGWTTREMFFGLAAAASLLLALLSLTGMIGNGGDVMDSPPLPVAERLERLRAAPDAVRLAWSNPTNDSASLKTTGAVVWSDSRQEGYMIIDDLQVNDPSSQQYQLWIFDTARTDEFPVDGGVFDIPSTGQVIVPIVNKLAITQAKAFAITIEGPGGVVVSERSRLPLLAGKL